MKLLIHLMLTMGLLILASCGAQKTTTTLRVSSGMAITNSSYPGGLVFYGRSTTGQTFSAPVGHIAGGASNQVEVLLDKGTWSFGAVGWAGSNLMEGAAECAALPSVNIDTNDKVINMDLNPSDCSLPHFGGNMTVTTGFFKPLRLVTCGSLYTNSGTETVLSTNNENFCTTNQDLAPDFKLHAKYARITIPAIIPGQAAATSPLSVCLPLTDGKMVTANTLPAKGLPLSIELLESSCTDLDKKLMSSYSLFEGINFTYNSFDHQYYPGNTNVDNSTLYLLSTISRRGISSLMSSMPRFKCDNANPLKPCIKIPSSTEQRYVQTNQDIYIKDQVAGESCPSSVSASSLFLGPSTPTNDVSTTLGTTSDCREDNGKFFIRIDQTLFSSSSCTTTCNLSVDFGQGATVLSLKLASLPDLDAHNLVYRTVGFENLLFPSTAFTAAENHAVDSLESLSEDGDNLRQFGLLSNIREMFSPDAVGGLFWNLSSSQMQNSTVNVSFWDDGEQKSYQIKSVTDTSLIPAYISNDTNPGATTSASNFTHKITISRILGGVLRLEQIIRYKSGQKIGMLESFEKKIDAGVTRSDRELLYWNTQGANFDRVEKYSTQTKVNSSSLVEETRSSFSRAERDGVAFAAGPPDTGANARIEEYSFESRLNSSNSYDQWGSRSLVLLKDDKAVFKRQIFGIDSAATSLDYFTQNANQYFRTDSSFSDDTATAKSPNGNYALSAWSFKTGASYNLKIVIKQSGVAKTTYTIPVAANASFIPKAIIDNTGKAMIGFVKDDGVNHMLFAIRFDGTNWIDTLGTVNPPTYTGTNAIDSTNLTPPQFALIDRGTDKSLIRVNFNSDMDFENFNGTTWDGNIYVGAYAQASNIKINKIGSNYFISFIFQPSGQKVGLLKTADFSTYVDLGSQSASTALDVYTVPNGTNADLIVVNSSGNLEKYSSLTALNDLTNASVTPLTNFRKYSSTPHCFSRSTTTSLSLGAAAVTDCLVPETSHADPVKPQFKFDIESLNPSNLNSIFTIPSY